MTAKWSFHRTVELWRDKQGQLGGIAYDGSPTRSQKSTSVLTYRYTRDRFIYHVLIVPFYDENFDPVLSKISTQEIKSAITNLHDCAGLWKYVDLSSYD